jgi:hypothetical protein
MHILFKCIIGFLAVAVNIQPGFGHLLRPQKSTSDRDTEQQTERELQGLCRNSAFVACDPDGPQGSSYGFQMCIDMGSTVGKLNFCAPTPFRNSGAVVRPTDQCGCCNGTCPNRQTCTCGCIDNINGNSGILLEATRPTGGTAAGRSFCATGTYEIQDGLEIKVSDMLINLANSPFKCIPASDQRCTEVITRGGEGGTP